MKLKEYKSEKFLQDPLKLVASQVNFEEIGSEVEHKQARKFQKFMGADWVKLIPQENSVISLNSNNRANIEQSVRKEYRLNTGDDLKTIVISSDHVTLEVKRYDGWESFLELFGKVCSATQEVFDPSNQLRLGVRFVNDFALPPHKENWKGLIPNEILGLAGSEIFMDGVFASDQRTILIFEDNTKCILRHALFKTDPQSLRPNFLLDFDAFDDIPVKFDKNQIKQSADQLHLNIGKSLTSCITDEMRSWLVGEK